MDIQFTLTKKPDLVRQKIGKVFNFKGKSTLTIGRSSDCDLALECPDQLLSRQHATLRYSENEVIISDTSSNGLFLNNKNIPIGNGNSSIIKSGDTIRLGDYAFTVSFANERTPVVTTQKPTALEVVKPESSVVYEAPSIPNETVAVKPKVLIPDDWDITVSEINDTHTDIPIPLRTPIDFSSKEASLAKSLLSGLNLSAEQELETISDDLIHNVAEALRVSIDVLFKQREYIRQQNKMYGLKETVSDKNLPQNTDQLIQQLLMTSSDRKTSDDIKAIFKESFSKQVVIFSDINRSLKAMKEQLSSYEEIQKKDVTYSSFTPPDWQELTLNLKKYGQLSRGIIKKHFDAKIPKLHQKRIDEKKLKPRTDKK